MESAGCLVVGLLLGLWLGRGRITHQTTMVFPTVRDRPLIYTVSKIRLHANNSEKDPIKEDGADSDDSPRPQSEMRLLRPSSHRRVA